MENSKVTFFYNYCYKCCSERAFSNMMKNGEIDMVHCTVCGVTRDYNDNYLKERYYKGLMGGVRYGK